MPGMDYDEYLKKQQELTEEQLKEQSAKNAAATANALGSAAVAYNDAKAIATSGGYSDMKSDYTPVTEESVAADTSTKGPTDEKPADDSAWDKAQEDYKKTMEDIANEQKEINAERQKQFDAMVFDYKERMKREEEEMRQREQGNMMSTMATGATEVAAGIINMLGVGELHASNQTYHSRDWMAKAEQDIKDHRRKRDGMYDTMQRLKMQQEQVRTSGRIEEMKLKQQQAIAALREAERQKEKEDREAKAKADRDADMLARGFVPDPSDPSGYRFDPDLAGQIATAKKTGGAVKSSTANGTTTATKPKQDTAAGGSTSSTASQAKGYAVPADTTASQQKGPVAPADTTSVNAAQAKTVEQQSDASEMSDAAAEALEKFFAAGGTPEMLTRARTAGKGNRRYNRTTFLPPTEKDWNRGIDKKNSPQGRKKDWSGYIVK